MALSSNAVSENRYHWMDSLRAVSILFGVAYHAVYSFFSWVSDGWYFAHDVSHSRGADILGEFLIGFRMPLFFAIAGFFAHLVYDRYGAKGFVQNRVRRIVLPFLIALPLWSLAARELARYAVAAGTFHPDRPERLLFDLHPGHLWFLYYVTMLDALALAASAATASWAWAARVRDRLSQATAATVRSPWAIPVLAAICGGILLTHPNVPYFSFLPSLGWIAFYGLFFAFGWLFYGQREALIPALPKRPGLYLLLAFPMPFLSDEIRFRLLDQQLWGEVLMRAIHGLYMWLVVLGLLSLFHRKLDDDNRAIRYISDMSYWLYLIHFPVVMWLQIELSTLPLIWPLKLSVICLLTFLVALVSYRAFVRYTALGRVLNGPRRREANVSW